MNIDAFLGNDAVRARLAAQLKAGTLTHSLLICGEPGCGTGLFARLLAADLLQLDETAADGAARARRVLEGAEPDCMEVSGDTDGKSGQIRVDRIREVRAAAQETSLSGSRRVVVVYGAEKMEAPAANALLKILEEPPDGVFFLITAASSAVVLATIRSRCGCVQLLPPSVELCRSELCRRGVAAADAARLAAVWQGRLGQALACAAGPRRALFDAAADICVCIRARDGYGLMKLFAPLEKDREGLQTVLADAVQMLRSGLGEPGGPAPAQAAQAMRALLDAAARLRGNGNARLVLTALCLQLEG